MALLARGEMRCGLMLRLRSYPGVELVTGSLVFDAAGRRRSPATMPGFHAGRPPRNKGLRYPADPPTIEEILADMRIAGDRMHGRWLRALVVVLWRAGLRIDEARSRPRSPPRLTARPARQRRATPRGRDGRLGLAGALTPGSLRGSGCLSARCSASSTDARADARGPPVERVPSSDAPPLMPAFADALLPPIATRTRGRDGQ
jgi:hypothetical protein